jgi:hypothetical protein
MNLAETDPRNKPAIRAAFQMPPASVGPCLWRHSPTDQDAIPAFITLVGSRSVMLTVFAPDNRGGIPYDGVRHISDPELSDNPDRSSGCWDYTPDQLRLQVSEALVHQHEDEIIKLHQTVAELKSLLGA